jgi:hypothetical protein
MRPEQGFFDVCASDTLCLSTQDVRNSLVFTRTRACSRKIEHASLVSLSLGSGYGEPLVTSAIYPPARPCCCFGWSLPEAICRASPAMRRPLGLPTSVGGVRTYIVLASPTLRWAPGRSCAALGRLPEARICAVTAFHRTAGTDHFAAGSQPR